MNQWSGNNKESKGEVGRTDQLPFAYSGPIGLHFYLFSSFTLTAAAPLACYIMVLS